MKLTILSLAGVFVFATGLGIGQTVPKPDPEIAKMIKEVSAKNIEATIRKLVSFGTRNTLSEQDNPTRGIGAATRLAIRRDAEDKCRLRQLHDGRKAELRSAEGEPNSRARYLDERRHNAERYDRSGPLLCGLGPLRFDVLVAHRRKVRRSGCE
jgi:hypothetical protein